MENFTCAACGAKFKSKPELDAHNQREHPGMMKEKAGEKAGTKPGEKKQY